MKKNLKNMLCIFMAVSMLLLAGCGNSAAGTGVAGTSASETSAVSAGSPESQKTGEESTAPAQTAGTENQGEKVVRINVGSEPDSLDPWMSAATDTEAIFMNVFEGLVRFDEAGSIIPGLAESWDISDSRHVSPYQPQSFESR